MFEVAERRRTPSRDAEPRRLVCRDCGTQFTWTVGEQQFFEERGMQTAKSCSDCRAARKALGLTTRR